MFLAGEEPHFREQRIREYLRREPSVGLLVAAVHFEWTVCRAVMFLSPTPNRELRNLMSRVYGLDKYEQLWRNQVAAFVDDRLGLPKIVGNWQQVRDAFQMRNRLVHGRDRATQNMAKPKVDALIRAAASIQLYCSRRGINFQDRIPNRRKRRMS